MRRLALLLAVVGLASGCDSDDGVRPRVDAAPLDARQDQPAVEIGPEVGVDAPRPEAGEDLSLSGERPEVGGDLPVGDTMRDAPAPDSVVTLDTAVAPDAGPDAASDAGSDAGLPAGPNCGCPAGRKLCGGATSTCVTLDNPETGCGGASCAPCMRAHATASCVAGACQFQCHAEWADCNGDPTDGCEAFLGARATCRSCATACAPSEVCGATGCVASCPVPLTTCTNGACSDLINSSNACGGCGVICSGTCVGGVCQPTPPCPTSCGGTSCIDTSSDPRNCGTCGNVCPGGTGGTGIAVCEGGRCGLRCGPGFSQCGAACVALASDNANCGACGNSCPSTCIDGQCQPASAETLVSGRAGPLSLAVDADFVYYADRASGTVHRLPKAGGSTVSLATGQGGPTSIAVDECHAYWTNTLGAAVNRAAKDGSAPPQLVAQADFATDVAVDATHAYWLRSGDAVYRAPKTGGTGTVAARGTRMFAEGVVYGFALDPRRIYFAYRAQNTRLVAFTDKAGGAETVLTEDFAANPRLYADPTHFVVSRNGTGVASRSFSIYDTTGPQPVEVGYSSFQARRALASDRTHVYWIADAGQTWALYAMPKCGGPSQLLRNLGPSISDVQPVVVADGKALYAAIGTKIVRVSAVGTPWPSIPASCPP